MLRSFAFLAAVLLAFSAPAPVSAREVPAMASAGAGTEKAWEVRYVKNTRQTIEKGVSGVMQGLKSTADLQRSVWSLCSNWQDEWEDSTLFRLEHDRDIDVYGNLYSLQVMCRILRLAAEDWVSFEETPASLQVLEQAQWLEQRSRRLADPVAEIIRQQSLSEFLPRRLDIMKEGFAYVDELYLAAPFDPRSRREVSEPPKQDKEKE